MSDIEMMRTWAHAVIDRAFDRGAQSVVIDSPIEVGRGPDIDGWPTFSVTGKRSMSIGWVEKEAIAP